MAVLLFLGFGVVLATPQEAAAQGRRLALAGPAGISTERPLCESILRSLNTESGRQAPDMRRNDPRFVTWQLLRIETIPPGAPYQEYEPNNIIEVAFVDILNDGQPRSVYRVTNMNPSPMGTTSEEFMFFMIREEDPFPETLDGGREWIESPPENIVEIESLLFGRGFLRLNRDLEFRSIPPAFANFTGLYFQRNFSRGRQWDRLMPDLTVDLIVTEEGRVLPVLQTGMTLLIMELRANQARPICYFGMAQEERRLGVVGPASGAELETTCVKIMSVLNEEIESILANPGSLRTRILNLNPGAEQPRASSLFLTWSPAYHASVYHGKSSPFPNGGRAAGNQIGPYENETIETIEVNILNDGVARRVFRYTEHSMISSRDIFSQYLIFQTEYPDGVAGALPGEPVWWFRHFVGRGTYRDIDAHYFGTMPRSYFAHGDYRKFLEQFPPNPTELGQEFKAKFGDFSPWGMNGSAEKEFDLIRLEDGRVLVLIEHTNRPSGASQLPLILVLELRPDRAIPVCYLG